MKVQNIEGNSVYVNISTGFWGIVDDEGNKWRPVNMPEQLKMDGARVKCTVQVLSNQSSVYMWGTDVVIRSFRTIGPA